MKVIDLLNKIANGEEVPKEIKYRGHLFKWDLEKHYYYMEATGSDLLEFSTVEEPTDVFLLTKVEIIEEQQEIDIQSIEEIEPAMNGNSCVIDNKSWTLNQVIKAIKQLDKKIKDKE